MAPSFPHHLLKLSLPPLVALLSYLWYRRKRIGARSDTGGTKPIEETCKEIVEAVEEFDISNVVTPEKINRSQSTPISTPNKKFNRSLSGVETAPIDIVYPPELRSTKSTPVVIPDEDLDLEIEKIKSMRNQYNSPSSISAHLSKTPSPKIESSSTTESKTDSFESANSSITVKESFEHNVLNSTTSKNKMNIIQKEGNGIVVKTNTPKKNKTKNKEKKQDNAKTTNAKGPQQNISDVEQKMAALKLNNNNNNNKEIQRNESATQAEKPIGSNTEEMNNHHDIHRNNSGRDSANHSPSDVMMASPSLSSMSDNHSEGSSDSGKGGSDVATPPPARTPQMNINPPDMPVCYEFVIPQNLVGKLIGRQGCFVQNIKDKSNAFVCVRRHPTNNRLKLCSVEGTQVEVDKALKMIRDKFPLKKYSEITLEQVELTPAVPTVSLIPDTLYLKLIEGINNDTILSCLVAPDHLFMQQPTHPSFPSLNVLTICMNSCYNTADSPLLPSPIPENTVCAAYSIDSWFRAIVLSSDEETDTSYVKFLDYGGYAYVENDKLRQIRQDFMLLPFQAAECFLSNVKPKNEDGTWPEEAYNLVADVTKGSIIYTQVADYSPEGVPLVLCYVVTGPKDVVFLNQRLVDEGYADWVELEDTPTSSTQPQLTEPIVA